MPTNIFPPLFEKENRTKKYLLWESIILALFENFKFNYEILGALPKPEGELDIHPIHFLKELPGYQEKDYYFNEKNHVHFNSFLGYGNQFTHYPMGQQMAYHHFTLETYQFIWHLPLFYISNWKETFPLLFSTRDNFFMESCNSAFLTEEKYLKTQNYPIPHDLHKTYFTKEYFLKNELPASLLIHDFNMEELRIPEKVSKTLHFCLKIFWESVLIQSSLQEIFGPSFVKDEQLNCLIDNWDFPQGKKVKDISLYRLNLLSFLYLSLHPAATVLCYGLYRTKYGVIQSHRTAFYVRQEKQFIALRDFLKTQVQSYVNFSNNLLLDKNAKDVEQITCKIRAALDLARMFGVGYQTSPEKGANPHYNVPVDFAPSPLAPELNSTNFVVEHTESSPLWRIFYDFCGEWWSHEEITQLIRGKGPHFERLKSSPRSLLVHICHKYTAHFWRENLEISNCPGKTKDHIKKTYVDILG